MIELSTTNQSSESNFNGSEANTTAIMCDTEKFEAELMTEDMLRLIRPDKFENQGIDMSKFATIEYKAPVKPLEPTKKELRNMLKKQLKIKSHS